MSAQTPGGTPTDPPSAAPAEPDALSVKTEAAAVATPEPGADAAAADAPMADAPVAQAPGAEAPAAEAPVAEGSAAGAPAAEAAPAPGELSPAACGARLAELFPALFVGPTGQGPFKPIKLRIQADIQARAPGLFSKRTLGIFFSRYTTTGAYLKALAAPGAQRFDLDGQPAGEIAEEHRAAAVEELARRHAIAAERRAAQRRGPPRGDAPAPDAGATAPEGGPTQAAPSDRPPRPPRPPRTDRPQDRGPRESAGRGPLDAPGRGPREARERGPRDASRPAPRGDARAHAGHAGPHHAAPQRPPRVPEPTLALPADPAQRARALLLRAFESSPQSKSHFCALKRMSEAELDTQLAQARAERGR